MAALRRSLVLCLAVSFVLGPERIALGTEASVAAQRAAQTEAPFRRGDPLALGAAHRGRAFKLDVLNHLILARTLDGVPTAGTFLGGGDGGGGGDVGGSDEDMGDAEESGLYNCFLAGTRVMTAEGWRPIA